MPTIFSHAVFASALGTAFPSGKLPARFWVLTLICPVLPDLDVVAFGLGIGYGSMLGHRGITHSIAFAIVVGLIVSVLISSVMPIARWKTALFFAAITLSHPLLDMLTDGGLGVALLAPFSSERFFFPWRPIEVSPIGLGFFSDRGLAVIASEALWIWIPSILIAVASLLIRRKR
jgi:inner membrane protein